ncbi:MAG: hypothetical protein WCH62_06685, partial [Candidatus Omnitrophota bacterium]
YFKFIEALLTTEDYDMLHLATDKFAANWYRIKGVDQTVFHGISFGDLVQVMFSRTYKVSLVIKYAEVVRKAIGECDKIKTIYFDFKDLKDEFDDAFTMADLISKIAQQFGATSVSLPVKQKIPEAIFTSRKSYDPQKFYLKVAIKESLKQVVKFSINLFSCIRNRFRFKLAKKNIYFFNYPNLNALLECDEQHFVVPDLTEYIFKSRVLFSGLTFLDFEHVKYQFNQEEINFLNGLKQRFEGIDEGREFGCDFIINGIDYSNLYCPIVKDMVMNIIPILLKYLGQVRSAIKTANINAVIMRDSLDEKSQVVLEACKLEDVKTIFVDHGIMGHLPAQKAAEFRMPDELITAGTFSPYRGMKAVALGNPCMDLYPRDKRKRVSSIKKILFLSFEDNFYARLDRLAYQEKYCNEIFSSFNELVSAGIEVFYRPHLANQNYHDYLLNFFDVKPTTFKYAYEGAFSQRIWEMDLLVTNISSCFFEAQAAGVPTIFMEPNFKKGSVLAPFNGTHGQEVLRVTNKTELLDLVLSNQHDPAYLNEFLDQYLSKYAPVYMGNLDGLASKRIIDHICPKDGL